MSSNVHIPYLSVFKNVLLLIAVNVDSNCCSFTPCPTKSVDDPRTIREDYPQTLQWKQPSTDHVKTANWLVTGAQTPTDHGIHPAHMTSLSLNLVPGDGAVYRICVLEVVRFFHLVDFVLHSKSLPQEGLVGNHDLQILHHLTGRIYVHVLIVISGTNNSWFY